MRNDTRHDDQRNTVANPSAGDLLAKPHQKHRAANQRRHARDAEDPARIDYGRHALSRAPAFEADGDAIALDGAQEDGAVTGISSEEHTSELQSLMRISYAVFCLTHKNTPI